MISRFVWISALALVTACGGDTVVSASTDAVSRTFTAAVGQELRIALGNVGPATYESPPQISSSILSYVDVEVVPPFNPGGPTQEFRFKAVSPGRAIVRFRRVLGESVVSSVEDTVEIR